MGDKTGIQWTSATWNPTTGCDRVSPGCDNCYALGQAKRLQAMGQAKYQTDGDPATSGPGFGIAVHPDTLDQPLRWTRPRRIFVNSMSDLFHAGVSDEFIAKVFVIMAATPRHTYQILTKRHGRMRSLLNSVQFAGQVRTAFEALAENHVITDPVGSWPLANVWLGVSAEDQQWADIRTFALEETPAAVRFLSCEPLLGPIDLRLAERPVGAVNWVIVGGESGPRARPMHPDWARSLRDQCQAAGVAYFHKQNGEWAPRSAISAPNYGSTPSVLFGDGHDEGGDIPRERQRGYVWLWRVGKHAAGRELDGREWNEFPAPAPA
jgi:protein gp37